MKHSNQTKICCFIFLVFLTLSTFAQEKNNLVSIANKEKIYSKILGEEREVLVHLPEPEKDTFAKRKYPVVYLLDGQAHIYSVAGLMHQLSSVNGNTLCPKMIVVAIPNKDADSRTRDYTPTKVTNSIYVTPEMIKTSGGGEKFTQFLEKELFPFIEAKHPTEPYRMLIGHSYGGLFAINTFVHHPDLFNSYLSLDPSLWWEKGKLLDQLSEVIAKKDFKGKSLYVAMANTLSGTKLEDVPKSKEVMLEHARQILRLTEILKSNRQNGLYWDWKYYPDESHQELPMLAQYDAFRFIFKAYRFPQLAGFLNDKSVKVDLIITEHFAKASQQLGYQIKPPEGEVNGFAEVLQDINDLDRAQTLFELNLKKLSRQHPRLRKNG